MEKVFFENKYAQKLCGILNKSDNNDKKIIILCHGGNSSKDAYTYVDFEKRIQDINISSFRFDFTGHGESEGNSEDFTIQRGVEDILSAIDFLNSKGFQEFAILGSSRGGTCALRAGLKTSKVKCLVLICPGSSFEDYSERKMIAKDFQNPLLIIHGDKDQSISIKHSKELCNLISDCRLEIVKGADHNFTDPEDHKKRLDLGLVFLQEYL